MDTHVASATDRARLTLAREIPGLRCTSMRPRNLLRRPRQPLERCRADIAEGDIIISMMLFMEDHFLPLLHALGARRENCDAMVCAMSAGEVTKLTRMGRFDMSAPSADRWRC